MVKRKTTKISGNGNYNDPQISGRQNGLNHSLRNIYSSKNLKRKTTLDNTINFVKTDLSFKDVGGYQTILNEITEFVINPMKHPEVFEQLGVDSPRGILFCGSSGCGKTHIAMATANECGASLIKIPAPEIIAGVSGESESRLRAIFNAANKNSPCIILIDDIDVICSKKDSSQRSMERRIVSQLVSCFDELNLNKTSVMVIATTNKPESLEDCLRRGGRFDKEVIFKIPSMAERGMILEKMTKRISLEKKIDIDLIAAKTPGFVAADLSLLIKEAVKINIRHIFEKLERAEIKKINGKEVVLEPNFPNVKKVEKTGNCSEEIIEISNEKEIDKNESTLIGEKQNNKNLEGIEFIVKEDFIEANKRNIKLSKIELKTENFFLAIKGVTPGFKREGFTSIPSTTWEEIGGLDELQEEMRLTVVYPILYPDIFRRQGLGNSTGVLFYGPPGCGKTLVAKAIANEAQTSFISIKGPELLNMYVGETEKAIRSLFLRASTCAPCIIFFDEIESLVPKRFSNLTSSEVSLRAVTQMLTEMDGLEKRKGVFVIAATNRPDVIDRAILRPGRLSRSIYISLPSMKDRMQIFSKHLKKIPCEKKADIIEFLEGKCEGFSGADCASLVQRAATLSLREFFSRFRQIDLKKEIETTLKDSIGINVNRSHFEKALQSLARSVSKESTKFYEEIRIDFENKDDVN